jgi:hypothetical protein
LEDDSGKEEDGRKVRGRAYASLSISKSLRSRSRITRVACRELLISVQVLGVQLILSVIVVTEEQLYQKNRT